MNEENQSFAVAYESADLTRRLLAAVEDVMDVESYRRPAGQTKRHFLFSSAVPSLEITGQLSVSADEAYSVVAPRFRELGQTVALRRIPEGDLIVAIPGLVNQNVGRQRVAIALFIATVLSVLFVGAMNEMTPANPDFNLVSGIPYMAALMAILVAHEMGHYIVARRLGIPASLPFFIPLPVPGALGTMGAAMMMAAPPRNRRHLLALGAAGPLAGLIVAVPVLLWGLSMSHVQAIPVGAQYFQEGNSILYIGLKYLIFGRFLPFGGQDVMISSVAMAGWVGLLVTALNLIPAGQLDGGHILYALIGEKAEKVTWLIMVVLVGLSFLWYGWLLWVGLIYVFGRVHAVPFDDITRLKPWQLGVAIAMLVILALVFVPIPFAVN